MSVKISRWEYRTYPDRNPSGARITLYVFELGTYPDPAQKLNCVAETVEIEAYLMRAS